MKKILKWGGILFAILIVLSVLASLGSDDDGEKVGENTPAATSQDAAQQPAQPTQTETKSDEPTVYQVGDKIQLGDVVLTVNDLETSTGGQYTNPSEGNHWIDLNLTIENTGSQQKYISTLGQMFILDDQNNQYQVAVTAKRLSNPGSTGLDGAVVATAKKTDWVGFEVPTMAKGLRFQYNAGFYNNKNVLVDLGM